MISIEYADGLGAAQGAWRGHEARLRLSSGCGRLANWSEPGQNKGRNWVKMGQLKVTVGKKA
jgi:hypothetical protein